MPLNVVSTSGNSGTFFKNHAALLVSLRNIYKGIINNKPAKSRIPLNFIIFEDYFFEATKSVTFFPAIKSLMI